MMTRLVLGNVAVASMPSIAAADDRPRARDLGVPHDESRRVLRKYNRLDESAG